MLNEVKTRFCRLIHKNYTYWGKNLDRCWTRKIFALWLSSVEETDPSSSSWKSTSRHWWSDWILENKIIFRIILCILNIGLMKWKSIMAKGGWNKKRFQYCTDPSGEILYTRALQGHSGRSLIESFITGQCHYSGRFLPIHLSCRMCNQFTFHHQFRIDTGRTKFEQKTDSIFLLVDPMDKDHKDPDTIELGTPRLAQYMHKAWKKHQNTVCSVEINLALKKVLKFYQTRSNAIILHEALPAYCIPKVVRMEPGEVMYDLRESICVTSASTKDFLETSLDEKNWV